MNDKIREVALLVAREMEDPYDGRLDYGDYLTRCLQELNKDAEPDFYIFKETSPRLGIPNVRADALPWVYDQDPSTGFTARLGVFLRPSLTEQDKEQIRREQSNKSLKWAADLAEKMGNAEIAEMIRLGAGE